MGKKEAKPKKGAKAAPAPAPAAKAAASPAPAAAKPAAKTSSADASALFCGRAHHPPPLPATPCSVTGRVVALLCPKSTGWATQEGPRLLRRRPPLLGSLLPPPEVWQRSGCFLCPAPFSALSAALLKTTPLFSVPPLRAQTQVLPADDKTISYRNAPLRAGDAPGKTDSKDSKASDKETFTKTQLDRKTERV